MRPASYSGGEWAGGFDEFCDVSCVELHHAVTLRVTFGIGRIDWKLQTASLAITCIMTL